MATITREYWNSLSEEEQNALIRAVSADNVLRGIGPSFQEFLAVKENTVTLKKQDLQLRLRGMFAWGFAFGVLIGSLVAMAVG